MATAPEKLATSLEVLKTLQDSGIKAIQSKQLPRTDRERLVKNGFLTEVIKGWYVISNPADNPGDSTTWYACYWEFCAQYLNQRFGEQWCLSPEQSLALLVGNRTVPKQLLVRTPKAGNNITQLLHDTSILDIRSSILPEQIIQTEEGLRLYPLTAALLACSASFFEQNPTDAYASLNMVQDSSDLLRPLLEAGQTSIAARLSGAFRHIKREEIADDIRDTMQAAGHVVREQNPFISTPKTTISPRTTSPYVYRIYQMWESMRDSIIKHFPAAPGKPDNIEAYLHQVEDIYVTDAYHSLSIEGYQVSPELIERVRSGSWCPDNDEADKTDRNALAARGYWQAYQTVRQSIKAILEGENPGTVIKKELRNWYRELFGPSVTAGILSAGDLAGFRNTNVYIRGSMHVPPKPESVRDSMPAFFKLLEDEPEPSVRIVLGHFIFVYIHPYVDGNGRLGRFLMNTMRASGGYEWQVIPIKARTTYMQTLEAASVEHNIEPFVKFLAKLEK